MDGLLHVRTFNILWLLLCASRIGSAYPPCVNHSCQMVSNSNSCQMVFKFQHTQSACHAQQTCWHCHPWLLPQCFSFLAHKQPTTSSADACKACESLKGAESTVVRSAQAKWAVLETMCRTSDVSLWIVPKVHLRSEHQTQFSGLSCARLTCVAHLEYRPQWGWCFL